MKKIVIFFLLIFPGVVEIVKAQPDCTLRKDSNGIKVYSCNVDGSKFKGIKAIFELDAELHQLVSTLYDVPSYIDWQYHMVSAKLVRQEGDELLYYSQVEAPWPVSNRDMIVKLQFAYDNATNLLYVNALGMPTTLPPVPDVVRIPYFVAKWTIQAVSDRKLSVQYELKIDVGGSIPAWLINMAQAEGPLETFSNLKEQLKLENYKENDYIFLHDYNSKKSNR